MISGWVKHQLSAGCNRLAAAAGDPLDFFSDEGFDKPREILVKPLLEHRMQELARQIVDATLGALTAKDLLAQPAERAGSDAGCFRRYHRVRRRPANRLKFRDADGTLPEGRTVAVVSPGLI